MPEGRHEMKAQETKDALNFYDVAIQAALVTGYIYAKLPNYKACGNRFALRDEASELFSEEVEGFKTEAVNLLLAELGGRCCDCEILFNALPRLGRWKEAPCPKN